MSSPSGQAAKDKLPSTSSPGREILVVVLVGPVAADTPICTAERGEARLEELARNGRQTFKFTGVRPASVWVGAGGCVFFENSIVCK